MPLRAIFMVISDNKKAPREARLSDAGGSGEIRTRDQRIKRSRGSSKPYINQWSKRQNNDCAIECAIEKLVKIGGQLGIRTFFSPNSVGNSTFWNYINTD